MTLRVRPERFWQRWLLITMGLMLIIASAATSYFLIKKNDITIASLKSEAMEADSTIREAWEDANRMEQQVNTAIMMDLLAQQPGQSQDTVRLSSLYQSRLLPQPLKAGQSLREALLAAADASRAKAVETVNDYYLRRQEAEEYAMVLQQQNQRYGQIAFFLQILGLALVTIARHLVIEVER